MVVLLDDKHRQADYAALTYPGYREFLAHDSTNKPTIGVGYALFGQPVGLALAYHNQKEQRATLLSILVFEAFRNYGIGSLMLARLEHELAQQGCQTIACVYPIGKPSILALERIFEKQGWEQPQPRMLICRSRAEDVERMMQADWMNNFPLPPTFTFFPWHEVLPEELEQLREELNHAPTCEEGLFPLSNPKEYEPINSVGLRYRGNIVGWMITRRLAPDLVRYEQLFVAHPFQRTGRAISLLAESIKRQYQHDGHLPNKGGVWTTKATNLPMVQFIKRRMMPYLSSLMETRETKKSLYSVV